jgi:uncharacterized protein (TIGR04255 family)
MALRPPDLPDYEAPPVDEVILGVQYAPILGSDTVLSSYSASIASDYPNVQYYPRIETPIEQLSNELPFLPVQIQFPFAPQNLTGRTWLVSSDDSLIIQIQNDRFMHNWRRRASEYPRFEFLVQRFWERYEMYRAALAEAGQQRPQPLQLEVSYVNWIVDQTISEFFRPGAAANVQIRGVDRYPEQQQWAGSYLARDESQPLARLTLICGAAMRLVPQPERGTQFQLTFKAPLQPSATDDQIKELALVGRDTIVRAFTDLTTAPSHRRWGRTDV